MNEKSKVFELQWSDRDSYLSGNQVDIRNMHASLNSVGSPQFSVGSPQFSVNSVKKSFLEAANLQIPDFAAGDRLFFGRTPKTLRLPKNGEMLKSVHGSPLGVYKEDNLAAMHESGDGSDDGSS